jgi:hypothetical protein
MTTITQLTKKWQCLLTKQADELALQTGFVVKPQKIRGSGFVQSLMWGWLTDADIPLSGLAEAFVNSQRQTISRQALHARFTSRAAHFMECMVETALKQVLFAGGKSQDHKWFAGFTTVQIADGTVIRLPDEAQRLYAGTEGSSLKIMVALDIKYGGLHHVSLHAGRCHDQQALPETFTMPANSLFLADLGFFKLTRFANIHAAGSYWLSRYKGGTQLYTEEQGEIDLLELLDQEVALDMVVQIGKKERLAGRLLALRVNDEVYQQRLQALKEWERRHQKKASATRWALCCWSIYLTNLSKKQLSLAQVSLVYRLRWQIELLFKLWKSELKLDEWRTQNVWRILCEFYAKFLAVLFVHGMMILAGGHDLQYSSVHVCHTIQRHAWGLARILYRPICFLREMKHLLFCLSNRSTVATSRSSPPTYQFMRNEF